jgi:hypothetical protein
MGYNINTYIIQEQPKGVINNSKFYFEFIQKLSDGYKTKPTNIYIYVRKLFRIYLKGFQTRMQ